MFLCPSWVCVTPLIFHWLPLPSLTIFYLFMCLFSPWRSKSCCMVLNTSGPKLHKKLWRCWPGKFAWQMLILTVWGKKLEEKIKVIFNLIQSMFDSPSFMLCRAPEVAKRQQSQRRSKANPDTFSTGTHSGINENSVWLLKCYFVNAVTFLLRPENNITVAFEEIYILCM